MALPNRNKIRDLSFLTDPSGFVTGYRNPISGLDVLGVPNHVEINYADISGFAASNPPVGTIAEIVDLRYSRFYFDGTRLRPSGGRQTLYMRQGSLAAPLATMTGNGAAQTFTLPGSLLIPANLIGPDMKIYVEVIIKRGGTAQGFTQVVCLGTANTCVSDQSFVGATIANVDGNEIRLFGAAQFFNSTTGFLSMGTLVPNSPTTAQQILKTTQVNTAADMYVSIGCSTTNFISPDVSNLISYHVWIEG
jgi:hypothetical protein